VAEISRHDFDFIWNWMPYARGLQCRTGFYQLHGIAHGRPEAEVRSGLVVTL
jgi:hypothetical protein